MIPGSGIPGRFAIGQISESRRGGAASGQVLVVVLSLAPGVASATAPGPVRFRGGALLASRDPRAGLALGQTLEVRVELDPGVALVTLPPMEFLVRYLDTGEVSTVRLEGFTAADLQDEVLMGEVLGDDAVLLDL